MSAFWLVLTGLLIFCGGTIAASRYVRRRDARLWRRTDPQHALRRQMARNIQERLKTKGRE